MQVIDRLPYGVFKIHIWTYEKVKEGWMKVPEMQLHKLFPR